MGNVTTVTDFRVIFYLEYFFASVKHTLKLISVKINVVGIQARGFGYYQMTCKLCIRTLVAD